MRQYLLGQLSEPDEEQVELRLLSDADYAEEFDIIADDLIDEYINNRLSEGDRTNFEQYFLSAPERRQKLEFERALRSYGSRTPEPASGKFKSRQPPFWKRVYSSPYLRVAASVSIALLLALGIWRFFFHHSDLERGLTALNAAYREQRPTEARISGFEYAPITVTRGGQERVDYVARQRAERLLLDAAAEDPGPESYQALGKFYLAEGEFDKAVDQFEQALTQSPNSPQIHSDLGAALLESSKQAKSSGNSGKTLALLSQSLEHINKALALNPGLPEALYNKALCLQYMLLPEQAKEAWQAYLARDPKSKWADEARRNLQQLSEHSYSSPTASQLLDSFLTAFRQHDEERAWQVMSRNREIITSKWIPPQLESGFVSATINGEEEGAQENLRAFFLAGELDRQRGGDPYTLELARYYGSSPVTRLHSLAEAIENLKQGYQLCLDAKYSEAELRFQRARILFDEVGDRLEARLADYWISYCYTQLDRIKESIALLNAVADFCTPREYKWLLAQADEWLAINYSILNEHSEAIRYHRQSLALAEAISDTYQMQKALTELGDEYAYLRQPQLALEHLYRSLSIAAQADASPRQSWRNFLYTTSALFAFRYFEAAAAVANEALFLGAKEFNDPSLSYMLRLNLGQIYSKLRRFGEAINQANQGLDIAQSVQDAAARQKFTAAALLKQAHIRREASDYGQAIQYYNRAIELYEQMQFDLYRYTAYKGRLLCSLALKDEAGVRRDLPVVLQLSERYRSQIREEQYRNSFFDTEQSVYDIAVEYEHQKGDDISAINYAEAGRARSLLDALKSGVRLEATATGQDATFSQVSQPLDVESIRANLPPRVHIILYAVLPAKLLIWSISRDQFAVDEKQITAEALENDVRSYVSSLRKDGAESQKVSRELGGKLYEILLGTVEERLGPGQVLCIIPDKFLYYLPFVSLISPESGKYLVESRAVFYAPSLNVLWHCSEEAKRKTQSDGEGILSIGNPTFDSQNYPGLPTLQAAEREAREVADLFGGKPTCLIGPEATKINTLRAMESAEIIHFAGHYLIDESNPLSSKMLLAAQDGDGSGGRGSVLSASEISGRKFDHTKLIVLSACQTGLDRYYNGEGTVGLSRAFIEAGIPLVVASQWAVDSGGTADLMISMYQHRRPGVSTAEALRRAQVEMLRGADTTYQSPYYWAAFICVGGYTEY